MSRHHDWRADLRELFAERRRARGAAYATWRLAADLASLAVPRLRAGGILQDARHALRLFRKHAGVVGVTIVGLGLAIATCTSAFGILNATVLKPYGMDDPSTVVRVRRVFGRGSSTSWPYSTFVELRRGATATGVEASLHDRVRVDANADDREQASARIAFVSGDYLTMLGGRAAAGRTLDASDDRPGATPVVVISNEYWRNYFGADAAIVGRTIRMGTGAATVVGILRPQFSGPDDNPPSFWAPFATYGAIYAGASLGPSSGVQVDVIARLAADTRRASAAARAELSGVAAGFPPAGFGDAGIAAEKTTGVQLESAASRISGPDAAGTYIVIAIIFIVMALVLALACANVANLLLAGTSSRSREFGLRAAMGASRQRLLRQLLVESLVISATAGVAGFFLSMWLTPLVARMAGPSAIGNVAPDFRVMAFTTLVALAAGLGAGLGPARFGARADVTGLLKAQSLQAGAAPRAARLRRGFLAFQAAASMLLLITAALFLRAAIHITRADLGFDANELITLNAAFPAASGGPAAFAAVGGAAATDHADDARQAAYWRDGIERVRAVPTVESASLALYPPFGGAVSITRLTRNGSEYTIFDNRTDASYFKTVGLRIVRGRGYTAEEVAAGAPVAVVSESVVREFFAGVEPIGSSLAPLAAGDNGAAGVTVIGVAADAIVSHVRGGGNGTMYRPIDPRTLAAARLVVRASDPGRVVRSVEAALTSVDPRARVTSALMRDNVATFMNEPMLLAGLSGAVALLALVLSVLGIFGVTSFVVGQRTQEVSVRMAVGASAADVVLLMIRQNMWPVACGLAAGLLAALAGTRVLTAALSGISPYDAYAIVPAVVVLAGTALAAVSIPAVRAARTDPAAVLRQ